MDLAKRLSSSAIAVRGYNVTNLGKTPELLAHTAYGPILRAQLRHAGELCNEITGRSTDLCELVSDRIDVGLDCYAEAISIIAAAELAQFEIARELHGIDLCRANCAFGYSLGELVVAAAAGAFESDAVLRIPLTMAADCASLAENTTMGVVFTRGAALNELTVRKVCEEISCDGNGTIGISAILSPNTMLVLGQGDTIKKLKRKLSVEMRARVNVRLNEAKWPPLHTPIVRQRNVPDRASVMIEQVPVGSHGPRLPVISLVTGNSAYNDVNTRTVLRNWVDQPQRLWEVVGRVLSRDVQTLIHVGPEPNVIPATFKRLGDNIRQATGDWSLGSFGLRAVQQMAIRPWLSSLLPLQGNLLRAPHIHHVIFENWLLENEPA